MLWDYQDRMVMTWTRYGKYFGLVIRIESLYIYFPKYFKYLSFFCAGIGFERPKGIVKKRALPATGRAVVGIYAVLLESLLEAFYLPYKSVGEKSVSKKGIIHAFADIAFDHVVEKLENISQDSFGLLAHQIQIFFKT